MPGETHFLLTLPTDRGHLSFKFVEDEGHLDVIGASGAIDGNFAFEQWVLALERLQRHLCEESRSCSPEEVERAATTAYKMALEGWFADEDVQPEPEKEERLHIYQAIFRLAYVLCQGEGLTTVQAAGLLTRNRYTAFKTLKKIEASHHVPLYFDETEKRWRVLANRYMRP